MSDSLSYIARYYDPVLSRWLSVDPLAEKYPGFSPYNYTADNPIMLVDPDGKDNYHIFSDGTIIRILTNDKTDSFIFHTSNGQSHNIVTYNKNKFGLINLPKINYNNGISIRITPKPGNQNELYISGNALASLIGASAVSKQEMYVTRASNFNGTSPGDSKSHINGKNIDIRFAGLNGSRTPLNYRRNPNDFFKIDLKASKAMNSALKKFGWKFIGASIFTYCQVTEITTCDGVHKIRTIIRQRIPGTRHLNHHHDHQHLQWYRPNILIRRRITPLKLPQIKPKFFK